MAVEDNMNGMAKLERVLGCTATRVSFAADETTGLLAFAAGSTVVVVGRQNQQFHLINNCKNNVTCITWSPDGNYIATGEFGHDPMVRVWRISREGGLAGRQVAELKHHHFGVASVRFIQGSKFLVSVGVLHDRSIVLWDWAKSTRLCENRLTAQVNAMDVANDGNQFVTVGVRHVKFWQFTASDRILNGRSGILSNWRSSILTDVCCMPGNRTFVIAEKPMLFEFADKKLLKVYDLPFEPRSITAGFPGDDENLFFACASGMIGYFRTGAGEGRLLPGRPHYLLHDIASASTVSAFFDMVSQAVDAQEEFPSANAVAFCRRTSTLSVLHNDRSIYQWRLSEDLEESLIAGYRNHVRPIYDVAIVDRATSVLPAGTIFTTSSDDTIRVWSFEKTHPDDAPNLGDGGIVKENVLSPELRNVIYLSGNTKALVDLQMDQVGIEAPDGADASFGARALCLSPDCTKLAAGLQTGRLVIIDTTTPALELAFELVPHSDEILTLEFSNPTSVHNRLLLASGARDRCVCIFDAEADFCQVANIEDHACTIVSLKFYERDSGYDLYTCSLDKIVVIRSVDFDEYGGGITVTRLSQISMTYGINHFTMTPDGTLLAACNDRYLRRMTRDGKVISQVKGTLCVEGTLSKVALDPSGTFAATICSDRYVYVIDTTNGQCVAVLNGQVDCVTNVVFTPDCKRLIVVSHSGCIFVWRLSKLLQKRMLGDRSTTPDSVIESGSDSASVTGGVSNKKELRDSEFGSLTSVHVAQDDDLDSGVGGGRGHRADADLTLRASEAFPVEVIPTEVVRHNRRSSLGVPGSTVGVDCEDELDPDENLVLDQSPTQNPPQSVASSRSMSNLCRVTDSTPRTRRRWGEPVAAPSVSRPGYDGGDVYFQHGGPVPGGMTTSISLHGLRSASNAFEGGPVPPPRNSFAPVPQRKPSNLDEKSFTTSADRERGGDRTRTIWSPQAPSGSNTSLNTSRKIIFNPTTSSTPLSAIRRRQSDRLAPPLNTSLTASTAAASSAAAAATASASSSSSSSLTPANSYLSATEPRMYANRASLILPMPPASAGGHESSSSSSAFSFDGTAPGSGSGSGSQPVYRKRERTLDRAARRRQTVSAYPDIAALQGVSSPAALKPLKEEDYESSALHLRSRSQSPSTLALNSYRDSERRTSRPSLRKPSDMGRITPSSSRSNLRASAAHNHSNSALNQLREAREKLKKSQENLSLAIGEPSDNVPSGTTASSMARSRSISSLSHVRAGGLANNSFGGGGLNDGFNAMNLSEGKRQIARSVTSLHNGHAADDPEASTLQAQYGNGGRQPSMSRLAGSIRNLKELSNPDLTNDVFYRPAPDVGNGNNQPPAPSTNYYSTTLPKNLKNRGAVSKRVFKANAGRFDQTSESDSTASDPPAAPTPYMLQGRPTFGSSLLRQTMTSSPVTMTKPRSTSSMGGTKMGGIGMGLTGRKPGNYLAHKFGQGENGEAPDLAPADDPSPRMESNVPSMETSHSKNMTKHLFDCVDQFNTACDRILNARRMIDGDKMLTEEDKQYLFGLVNKAIFNGKNRLASAVDSLPQQTQLPNHLVGSQQAASRTISSTGSNASSLSAATGAQPQPSPLTIDASFINRYGPQLIQALQANMAKQN